MLVGHIAVGLLAKRRLPSLSLGTVVLAALLADLLWCVLAIAGVEKVEIVPGRGAANYWRPVQIGFSHSLAAIVLWAAVFTGVWLLARKPRAGAAIVFAAVLSHWPLDFVSHRPDMPLAPGLSRTYGLGLWASVPATLVVEGGLWVAALALYAGASRPARRGGTVAFWIVAAAVTLAWYNNIAGPPPPDPRTAPVASLVFFSLIVAWAYWMNRARPARVEADGASGP
jgi:hypothetical protein